jgi:hypothetical protein
MAPENENASRDYAWNIERYPSNEDSEWTYDSGSVQITSLYDLVRIGPQPIIASGFSTTMSRNFPQKPTKLGFNIQSHEELGEIEEAGFTAALKTPGRVGIEKKKNFGMSNSIIDLHA